jgi:hypothetical protein
MNDVISDQWKLGVCKVLERALGMQMSEAMERTISLSPITHTSEHTASVKGFVSLQFLNQDSLDGGSARRKAATYTGLHKHSSCLRPLWSALEKYTLY